MTRKSHPRWRYLSDSKPSLLKYIKVLFSLIALTRSHVVHNDCDDDCDYDFTSSMFSDGVNNYLTRYTGGFSGCGDAPKKFYDRNTDTITQIQQGQLCHGGPASYPYPTQWQLTWEIAVSPCSEFNCTVLDFYVPKNTALDMDFISCVEAVFSKNEDQYHSDIADCPKKFNYAWLALPAVVFLIIAGWVGYECKKRCNTDDDDDDIQNYINFNSNYRFLSSHSHRLEQSLQSMPRYEDEEMESKDYNPPER